MNINKTITDKDIKELARLGKYIRLGLECVLEMLVKTLKAMEQI